MAGVFGAGPVDTSKLSNGDKNPNDPNLTWNSSTQTFHYNPTGANPGPSTANSPDWQTKDLNRNNPLPWQTYLPDEIGGQGGVASKLWGQGLDPNFASGKILAGVGSDSAGVHASSLGSATGNAMSSAISNKYNAQVGNKLDAMKAQEADAAPLQQSQALSQAADIFGKDQAIAVQNFKEQYQYQTARAQAYDSWKNAQSQADASMWGSIISAGTAIAGAAIGGPVGGAVGAGIGKAASNATNTPQGA